jgi:hypothetical protein
MTASIKITAVFVMFAAFPFGVNAFAETKPFIKDHTFQADERNSKELLSCGASLIFAGWLFSAASGTAR